MRPDRICHLGMARTFQVVRPFPEMTVFENVKVAAVFGKPSKRPPSVVDQEIREILENTGLFSKAGRLASSLSLPERKRLEVARTLATQPKLLLLDEVLAGLNPREVEEAIPLIRSLNHQMKISILLIEHNLRAIMGICDRLLVFNFGQLIFDGLPTDAVENPEVIKAYLGEREDAQGRRSLGQLWGCPGSGRGFLSGKTGTDDLHSGTQRRREDHFAAVHYRDCSFGCRKGAVPGPGNPGEKNASVGRTRE